MASVVSSNNIANRDNRAPAPAVKDDGSNYPWRMFYDNGQHIVDADTTSELLEYLIPGYLSHSSQEQELDRHALAVQVQTLLRATIISRITSEQAQEIEDWEWEILHYGDTYALNPYGWGDGSGNLGEVNPGVNDEWSSVIPLVLIDTSYQPYTEIPKPLSSEGDYQEVSNIIWLRPDGEESLLRSLSRVGYITFGSPSQPLPLS